MFAQKPIRICGFFLTEHILEKVPHRQIVFSLPKITRKAFLYNRELLPKLAHCGWETILEVFQAALDSEDLAPGMIVDIQTYGGLLNSLPDGVEVSNRSVTEIKSTPCFSNNSMS